MMIRSLMRFNRLVQRRSSLLLRTQQQQFRSESTETTSENKEEKGPCGVQGLFGNFLLQTPKGFQLLTKAVEMRSMELVREIVNDAEARTAESSTKRTTVELVDDLSNEICSAADLTDCVRCMHADPEYTKAADEAMRFFTYFVETLNTTPELYAALKQSLETEKHRLDPISLRTAKLLLEEFENSGIQLDEDGRQHFVQLSDEVFDAGSRFVAGCDRPVPLGPDEQKEIGAKGTELSGPWTQHSDHRIRTLTYDKYFAHNPEQESLLKRLISARHQIARLTKFPTFAHRAQSNSVLCTYENVQKFLRNTIKEFSGQIDTELEQIRRIISDNSIGFNPAKNTIGLCDVEYATMLHRNKVLDGLGLNRQSLSAFFNLCTVLDGFQWLCYRLYGIRFQKSEPEEGECWPGNVLKLNVFRENETADSYQFPIYLGTIFVDFDTRKSKQQGDCHFTVRCSKLLDNGEFQTPIVVLSLAIASSPPAGGDLGSPWDVIKDVQMSPQQADNFFHEMGHAIHSILGQTKFQHVAGTRCPTDFAEVPSNLMECFFADPRVLCWMCRFMSEDQAEAIIKSRKVFNGIHTVQQAIFALFDLELHGERAAEIADGRLTSTQLFGEIHRHALPQLAGAIDANYAYHHRISHLVTYGAKYYSYLVARASAALIYDRLFSADPFSRENGLKWAEVQAYGGEYPSDVLLAKALGTPEAPTPEQLTSVLLQDSQKGRL